MRIAEPKKAATQAVALVTRIIDPQNVATLCNSHIGDSGSVRAAVTAGSPSTPRPLKAVDEFGAPDTNPSWRRCTMPSKAAQARHLHGEPRAGLSLLFEDDALIFLSLNSRSLRFGPANGGSPALKIDFEGMPHIGIWTKPGAPYLCIEPWAGYASPAAFSGPLTEKPGSMNLTPGEAKNFSMSAELI